MNYNNGRSYDSIDLFYLRVDRTCKIMCMCGNDEFFNLVLNYVSKNNKIILY